MILEGSVRLLLLEKPERSKYTSVIPTKLPGKQEQVSLQALDCMIKIRVQMSKTERLRV